MAVSRIPVAPAVTPDYCDNTEYDVPGSDILDGFWAHDIDCKEYFVGDIMTFGALEVTTATFFRSRHMYIYSIYIRMSISFQTYIQDSY